jgi:site-specific recombinase XerD
MSSLHDALTEYLATRRALGTQLKWPESSLRKFVDFVETEGAQFISTELAVRWAIQSVGVQPATHARRLAIVRGFAIWLQATDARTQVPPQRLLPAQHRRPAPHIYSDREIADLMAAVGQLRSASGLRGATLRTLLGLLAATGMRPGEVLALDVRDVDLAGGVLTVRESKFGKSRFVPLDESTRAALAAYATTRDALRPSRDSPAFLITFGGGFRVIRSRRCRQIHRGGDTRRDRDPRRRRTYLDLERELHRCVWVERGTHDASDRRRVVILEVVVGDERRRGRENGRGRQGEDLEARPVEGDEVLCDKVVASRDVLVERDLERRADAFVAVEADPVPVAGEDEDEDEVEGSLDVIERCEEALVEEAVRHEREAACGSPDSNRPRGSAVDQPAVAAGDQEVAVGAGGPPSLRACASMPARIVVWWRPKRLAISKRLYERSG